MEHEFAPECNGPSKVITLGDSNYLDFASDQDMFWGLISEICSSQEKSNLYFHQIMLLTKT